MWPSHYLTGWHYKARTTTTMQIPFTKILSNRTELPNLRLRIFRHHEGPPMLVSPTQRNIHPGTGLHRSCKPSVLLQTPKNWSPCSWLPARARTIQYPTRIQIRSHQPSRCTLPPPRLWNRRKSCQWQCHGLARCLFLQPPHQHQSVWLWQPWSRPRRKSLRCASNSPGHTKTMDRTPQSHYHRWHPLVPWTGTSCHGRQCS